MHSLVVMMVVMMMLVCKISTWLIRVFKMVTPVVVVAIVLEVEEEVGVWWLAMVVVELISFIVVVLAF